MDSAYHVLPENRDRDVVINASYCGVLPARFIGAIRPRGVIGVDCGVGPAGGSIAGLWYLEALNVPAAVADVMRSAEITSELQSPMRSSHAVFCLKNKTKTSKTH